MREKLGGLLNATSLVGITPACAGKTPRVRHWRWRHWDHPRVCGKNDLQAIVRAINAGSPPRVREKQRHPRKTKGVTGITPACAGKTLLFSFQGTSSRDHPRVCGKNVFSTSCRISRAGSPPRVREKRNL